MSAGSIEPAAYRRAPKPAGDFASHRASVRMRCTRPPLGSAVSRVGRRRSTFGTVAQALVPPPTAHRPPPAAHRPPPTAHRPPPTAHQPPTTNHQPPTTNHRSARVISAPDPSVRRCRARRVPRPPRSSRAMPQYFVPDAVNAPDKRAAALSVAARRRGCSQSGQPGQPGSRRDSVHGDPTRANRARCLHAERLGAQRSSVNRPSNAPRLRRGCARLARHAAFSRDLITLRHCKKWFSLIGDGSAIRFSRVVI